MPIIPVSDGRPIRSYQVIHNIIVITEFRMQYYLTVWFSNPSHYLILYHIIKTKSRQEHSSIWFQHPGDAPHLGYHPRPRISSMSGVRDYL